MKKAIALLTILIFVCPGACAQEASAFTSVFPEALELCTGFEGIACSLLKQAAAAGSLFHFAIEHEFESPPFPNFIILENSFS